MSPEKEGEQLKKLISNKVRAPPVIFKSPSKSASKSAKNINV